MNREKEPLYRKTNKRALNYRGNTGGDFRHVRHTKEMANFDGQRMGMGGKKERGRDYTPLFRFLLARVGKKWEDVHKEAVSRLDTQDPIWWMVAAPGETKNEVVWIGENSRWSGLFIDNDGILQKINPNISIDDLKPTCSCCTHTFNGKVIQNSNK